MRDIGLYGKRTGWTLIIGGSSGRRPRIGDVLAEDLSPGEVVDLTRRALEYYRDKSKGRQRMARFVDRIGIDNIREAVL